MRMFFYAIGKLWGQSKFSGTARILGDLNPFRQFPKQADGPCPYASALRAGLGHGKGGGAILDIEGYEFLAALCAFE